MPRAEPGAEARAPACLPACRTSKKQVENFQEATHSLPTSPTQPGRQLRKDPGTVPSLPVSRPACKLARVVCVPWVVVHARQLIHIHGTELALILVVTMSQEEHDSRAPLDVCSVSDFDVQSCASWVGRS
jgi:hypothetical protein